jgi:hypothetical protein
MKKSLFSLFLSLFIIHAVSAQELIKNGNFEMRTGYPTTYGQAYLMKYWNSATKGKWSGVNYFYDTNGEIRSYIPRMREGGKQALRSS